MCQWCNWLPFPAQHAGAEAERPDEPARRPEFLAEPAETEPVEAEPPSPVRHGATR